jgi:RimJ/RimL family protein N-acetyltransferase
MTDEAVVRRAMRADLEGYRRCIGRVAAERRWLVFVDTPPPDSFHQHVGGLIDRGLPAFVAVTAAGEVVGWCDIHVPPFNPVREGFDHVGVLGMGLDAAWRGLGLGDRLMAAALAAAEALRIERVELDVFAGNDRARRLYERHGFVVEGVRRQARKLDGRHEDVIVMGRLKETL